MMLFDEWFSKKWRPLDMQKFKSFLACLILMGLVGKTHLNEYWETDQLTHTPAFHNIMSRNRFKQILEFLHFSKALPSKKNQFYLFPADELQEKVFEITDMFVAWKKSFQLDLNVFVDESICGFGGTLAFKQYIPQKAHQRGIKFFHIACAKSSYVINTYIYTGKNSGKTDIIVRTLVQGMENQGHHIFLDSYFTSLKLVFEMEAL